MRRKVGIISIIIAILAIYVFGAFKSPRNLVLTFWDPEAPILANLAILIWIITSLLVKILMIVNRRLKVFNLGALIFLGIFIVMAISAGPPENHAEINNFQRTLGTLFFAGWCAIDFFDLTNHKKSKKE